jgi:protein PsiE
MSKNKNLIQVLIGLTEQALLLTIAIATIGAAFIEIVRILSVMTVNLIIAITALTRMIVIQTKGLDSVNIIFEASGILLLAIAAYIMSKKEELSLKKLIKKKTLEDSIGDKG